MVWPASRSACARAAPRSAYSAPTWTASPSDIAAKSSRAARADWRYIGFDAALDHVTSQRWLTGLVGERAFAFRASDLFSQAQAARAGLGAACPLAERGAASPRA